MDLFCRIPFSQEGADVFAIADIVEILMSGRFFWDPKSRERVREEFAFQGGAATYPIKCMNERLCATKIS